MYKENEPKKSKVFRIILIILYVLAVIAFLTGRGLSLLPGWGNIVDTYQYYSQAYLVQDHMITKLTSGISYAYAESLAELISLVGDEKWFLAVYHMILQIITLLFLSAGFRVMFGKTASYIVGFCYLLSPWIFESVFLVTPDNYMFLFWSIGLFLVSLFYYFGKTKGWLRNNRGEGYLMFLGFVLGMLLTWHFYNGTLIILFFIAIAKNNALVKERISVRERTLELLEIAGEPVTDRKLKAEVMPGSSQVFVVFGGIFVGVFATLMKYTGVTGSYLGDQFRWWLKQLVQKVTSGRYQDIAIWFILQATVFLVIGILFLLFDHSSEEELEAIHESLDEMQQATKQQEAKQDVVKHQIEKKPEKEEMVDTTPEKEVTVEKETTPVKKTVELLENPLPLPKKHVKKVMDFDDAPKKDDFDFAINDDDDFDV